LFADGCERDAAGCRGAGRPGRSSTAPSGVEMRHTDRSPGRPLPSSARRGDSTRRDRGGSCWPATAIAGAVPAGRGVAYCARS